MERKIITPRNQWQKAVEELGFGFHTAEVPYWDESVYYQFTLDEINLIEKATAELWGMCLQAVQYVIDKKEFEEFFIPKWMEKHIIESWERESPSIYGRFDFAFNNGYLKLLEFNADTPTSLFEAGIVQWFWLQDFNAHKDQFNSIHEKLIAQWEAILPHLHKGKLHFACVKNSLEDLTTAEYLRDCAMQAGIETKLSFVEDLGWDVSRKCFMDVDDQEVVNIFKLYPYEWLVNEPFGKYIPEDGYHTIWIEPSWKMILSNKGILPLLWFLFPNHPYLLPAYFDEPRELTHYAKKPIFSREGANIELVQNGHLLAQTDGEYGEEGFIYQGLFPLPDFDGNYPLIGSWIIGEQPAGIGIRESSDLITNNKSRFVPHLIHK